MANRSIFDDISKGLGEAITDIREKLVEEPWFGRALTEHGGQAPAWPQAQEPSDNPAIGSSTHVLDVGPTRDQIGDNANYRLAAMERELNSPQWPTARETHEQNGREQNRDKDIDIDR